MKEFVGLRAKTYSCLKDNNDEVEKAEGTKKCHKKQLKFQDHKNRLGAAQIENKVNHLEKDKIDVYSLKEDQKEFLINNNE